MAAKKAVTVLKKNSKKPQKAENKPKKADIDTVRLKNKKNSSIFNTEKQLNASGNITKDEKSTKKSFSSIKTSGHLEDIGNVKQRKLNKASKKTNEKHLKRSDADKITSRHVAPVKSTNAKKTENISKDAKNNAKQNQSDVRENISSLKRKMNREIFHKCLERKLLHGGEVWSEMDMSSSDEM